MDPQQKPADLDLHFFQEKGIISTKKISLLIMVNMVAIVYATSQAKLSLGVCDLNFESVS